MRAEDFPRFREVLAGMAEMFKHELSGPLLDAYWLALKDWPLVEFEQAAAHLLGTEEFMPRPVKFNALRKANRPTSGEGFAIAVAHAASGAWREGGCSDPMVNQAVRSLGGWRVIAMCDEDKLPFLERRFAEHFETITDAEDVRDALPYLTPTRPALKGPQPLAAILSQFTRDDA